MPTSYTAKIIEGEVKDFKSFAKLCMRNFGACMHMRDYPLEEAYFKSEPSDYYLGRIEEEKRKIEAFRNLTDQEIIDEKIDSIKNSIKRHKKKIIELGKLRDKLETFREEIISWTPPGEDYLEIKKFMLDQIETTIRHDCDIDYHSYQLSQLDPDPKKINPSEIRESYIKDSETSISLYLKRHADDIQLCEDKHQWVVKLLESVENHGKK